MDLCCGRGGDILKWQKCGVTHVTGVDMCEASVREAERRYCSAKASDRPPSASFFVADAFTGFLSPERFQSVSCMFAAHYAASSERKLQDFLGRVAAQLVDAGFFFGICADGDRIVERAPFRNLYVNVQRLRPLEDAQGGELGMVRECRTCGLGDAYTFDLCDTVVADANIEYVSLNLIRAL